MLVLTSVISDITSRACLKLDLSTPVIRNVSHFTCDDNPYVNGCNVPFRAYRMALQSECNKHDICYSCVSFILKFGFQQHRFFLVVTLS